MKLSDRTQRDIWVAMAGLIVGVILGGWWL
jgi:hypothetical protein